MRTIKKILGKYEIEYIEEVVMIFNISGYRYCILHNKSNNTYALGNYISEMRVNRITEFMSFSSFKYYLCNFLDVMIDYNGKILED